MNVEKKLLTFMKNSETEDSFVVHPLQKGISNSDAVLMWRKVEKRHFLLEHANMQHVCMTCKHAVMWLKLSIRWSRFLHVCMYMQACTCKHAANKQPHKPLLMPQINYSISLASWTSSQHLTSLRPPLWTYRRKDAWKMLKTQRIQTRWTASGWHLCI